MRVWLQYLLAFVFILGLVKLHEPTRAAASRQAETPPTDCEQPGWFPDSFGLKDHTIFFANGFTYIMANHTPQENRFAYARSTDWCNWEDLGPILTERRLGKADDKAIWAPFVLEERGTYYAYYTGVTTDFTQSIMLVTTQNPADPASWQEQGVIFQPNHPQAKWTAGVWADCRDPMVLKEGETYYLYYTGRDSGANGEYGIVGLASASSPEGPWSDHGATLNPSTPSIFHMMESPTVYQFQGNYYLFFNNTSKGEEYRIGNSPTGPWSDPQLFRPGWAHELWTDGIGQTYTSYLTNYSITISPVSWSYFSKPPMPFIGSHIHYLFTPIAFHFP